MAPKSYWLDLFTPQSWKEFLDAGSKTSGFRESRWSTVQKIQKGDYLLCYITRISRFIGVLEVTGEAYKDNKPIWSDDIFPCRLHVKPLIALTVETAVPVLNLRDQLSAFEGIRDKPYSWAWTGKFRGSPTKWSIADGEAVLEALREAERHPVMTYVSPSKLKYRPKAVETQLGLVTVPESDSDAVTSAAKPQALADEPTVHTEVQSLILKLGSDMGFDVWVAKNDKGRSYSGMRFSDYPKMKASLPLQFDKVTNRTIELIDVLWLQGNAIVAAFEIESTTSIYSGLLRMADLLSMQPNLNIPLYLVAPDERRDKVLEEVNRPTFSRLSPKLSEMCRFISFSALRERLKQVQEFVRFLKPDFLEELSESCELGD
jgi:predicted RNA-binding protein